ncbi:isochorismatase family protein [Pseudonocardia sp. HH130630-07]|uniref:isochorismatase family protein n=1 Tax=Pseudonocardia sp. HH130630-07 TaxID=1690815 RepID=UPI000815345C|nr:isochorismatase family protein [Pseudonocardia sp. HH130630-07]ANY06592.1 isochorismatase [Pseudonocardia sp. HH130630-07]
MDPAAAEALIVVDLQTAFVRGADAVPDADRLVAEIDRLLGRARAAGALIVHLRNDGPAGAPDEPGTDGWSLLRDPAPAEPVVAKSLDDGFRGTDLGEILRAAGVRRIAVCGVLSEMCVAATARAALDRDYGVVLAHRAHGTYDVPPGPGSDGVPAAQAARAAEWSLGDEVEIVADAGGVTFVPVPSSIGGRPRRP